MSMWRRCVMVLAATLVGAFVGAVALADEGMWLVNQPPREALFETYGFDATPEWMERMQKSAVRLSSGGSGSVVSGDGLVMTNHHVIAAILYKLSTPERDLLEEGYYAETQADELPCPDLELDILWEIEDVTARVKSAGDGMDAAGANAAMRKMRGVIEQESEAATGLHSEVVTLYKGGRYHLYRYKRFTDVRLVFAPEQSIAFFGGDNDNFEYPRFCLDASFVRIYEDGEPWQPEHFLGWSEAGSGEGDLAFVFGHPGRTRRLYTADHLEFMRDVSLPGRLGRIWRLQAKLGAFSGRSKEWKRIAQDDLFGVQNGRKFLTGQLERLHDPSVLERKRAADEELRSAVMGNPEWASNWGDAWGIVAEAQETHRGLYTRRAVTNVRGRLFDIAHTLVHLADELPKPSPERLSEYRDSALDSVYRSLYSPAPIYPEYEAHQIAWSLAQMAEQLGGDDPLVRSLLAGQAPMARARELVAGTRLMDIEVRRGLAEGGADAVDSAGDPLIELARMLDPAYREMRTAYEDGVESLERKAYEKIAAAQFAVYGESVYPDATFTLRMTYGPIKSYREGSETIAAYTDFDGLFERQEAWDAVEPFRVPDGWTEAGARLDRSTPFNFVLAVDIIGGNSGSPVVNRAGEVIGLIFDGNLHFRGTDIMYDDRQGRAISVDSRGMLEAIDAVYDAQRLVRELKGVD